MPYDLQSTTGDGGYADPIGSSFHAGDFSPDGTQMDGRSVSDDDNEECDVGWTPPSDEGMNSSHA